jgi:hypothetical protein
MAIKALIWVLLPFPCGIVRIGQSFRISGYLNGLSKHGKMAGRAQNFFRKVPVNEEADSQTRSAWRCRGREDINYPLDG